MRARGMRAEGETKKITVIGAGIAGLVAAYELERLGHRVEILEGSRRIGGRIHTHRFGAGDVARCVELGAMRIPTKHRRAMGYLAELGLADKVREFRTLFSEENAYYTTSSGCVRVQDAIMTLVEKFRPALRHRHYSEETILFCARLTAIGDAIVPANFRVSLLDRSNLELLDLVERIDLAPFLGGSSKDQVDLHAFFAAHPELLLSCGGHLNRFIDDILTETSPDLVQLDGGMDQLAWRFIERIQGPVRCGQEVVGFDVRENDVLVDIRLGDRMVTKRCDYVLCTIPFSVLRRLRLAGLSEAKMAAIHEMTYWSATKVAFHCKEAVWERAGITGGASFSGGRVGQTYYPPAEGDPTRDAVLLASYTIGDDADALGLLPVEVRHAVVLKELSAMHPDLWRPGMVLDAVSSAWGNHWWSAGACTVRWGKDAAACEEERVRAASPERRLFFAGEHCSSSPAWIEGAIESAIDAVREIWLDERDPVMHRRGLLGVHR